MFTRRKAPAPELTQDAYGRWLRAQRPPMVLFLGLSEIEQEVLACMGDEHATEMVEAFALAMANPQALATGVEIREAEAGDTGAEASLAQQLAAGLAAKLKATQKAPEPWSPPRETMAGFGERRNVETKTIGRKPKLFGREGVK